MNITVYCGASFSSNPAHEQAARALGTWIGENGHHLVYGGSCMGLMGVIADSVLDAGGQVFGVEPRFMIERELQHDGITELVMVETMGQRKEMMIARGEAFVALPGGIGTLEEISEIASRVRLDLTDAPCVLYSVDGYYDSLRDYFDQMTEVGFFPKESRERVVFADTLDEVVAALGA